MQVIRDDEKKIFTTVIDHWYFIAIDLIICSLNFFMYKYRLVGAYMMQIGTFDIKYSRPIQYWHHEKPHLLTQLR